MLVDASTHGVLSLVIKRTKGMSDGGADAPLVDECACLGPELPCHQQSALDPRFASSHQSADGACAVLRLLVQFNDGPCFVHHRTRFGGIVGCQQPKDLLSDVDAMLNDDGDFGLALFPPVMQTLEPVDDIVRPAARLFATHYAQRQG